MNIGIDLDGTITDFHKSLLEDGIKFLEKNNIKYKIKDENKFETEDIFELEENDLIIFKEYIKTKLRMNVFPRENASLIIKKLSQNNKIFIITSRKEKDQIDCYNNTKKWLLENDIYYDKLVLGNSNKLEECLKHNIDIFIDDKIKHVTAVNNAGIKAILFDNVYNKDSSLNRIYSFNELIDRLR